jgi:uncharacterized membrane protein YoaK (UPF0700 family)
MVERMAIRYLRGLTTPERSEQGTRHLARYLAFIAGASNAGGFLAVHQYTSHMSGAVSAMAGDLVLGRFSLAWVGVLAVSSFLAGSVMTTLLIRWARRRNLRSEYALPLLCESIVFAVLAFAPNFSRRPNVTVTIAFLCFAMGLQNAMITKLSGSVIRTTHITGMITDIGIACGRLLVFAMGYRDQEVSTDLRALRLLGSLVVLFFLGGLCGAAGFLHLGLPFVAPLAATLFLLAFVPVVDDFRSWTAEVEMRD